MKTLLLLGIGLLGMTGIATAQPSKPSKPAQPTKPQAPKLGAVQMAGDNGKIGTTYSIGDKGDELNLTLESAEFALRAPFAEEAVIATAEQKLLLLTFTVANPQKRDMALTYSSFKLTAVAPDDANSEFDGWIYHPERHTRLETTLKPAQKAKMILAFPIHAKGPVNKLIVKRGEGPVLRYDLRGKVKPMAGVFTAERGVDAVAQATAAVNTVIPLHALDWTVEGVETSTTKVGEHDVEEGQKLILVNVTIKNPTMTDVQVAYNTLAPKLLDANDETIEWTQDLVSAASNRTVETTLKPGASVRARYVFRAPADAKAATLVLEESAHTQRTVTIKLP